MQGARMNAVLLLMLFLGSFFVSAQDEGMGDEKNLDIGYTHAGGIIFLLDGEGGG